MCVNLNFQTVDVHNFTIVDFFEKSQQIMKRRQPISTRPNRLADQPTFSIDTNAHDLSQRILRVFPGLTVNAYEYAPPYKTLFDNSYNSIPTNVADLYNAVTYTVGTNYMFKTLSNKTWISFKKVSASLNLYLRYTVFNAYFDGNNVIVGNGLATPDVISHEWTHGYTKTSANLIYSYQSGAISEAMSDM